MIQDAVRTNKQDGAGVERRSGQILTPPATVAAIEMVDLCKSFGKNRAVDHLTLTVEPGEIFGLLGPNGSGKTTTINMISGLSLPSSGTVRVLGHDVQRHPWRVKRCLGCVPQETALFEELTAEHNMRYHAALYGVPRGERGERIAAMLKLLHLYEKRRDLVRTYSGGMKRRLALARALLHDPQVLYLDEPSLGVDVQNRYALYQFIRQLPEKGVTVLLTTNDMHEAEQLCTRVAIIDHGRLVAVDSPRNLIRQTSGSGTQIDIRLDEPSGAANLAEGIRELAGVAEAVSEGDCLAITTCGGQDALADILSLIMARGRSVRQIEIHEAELESVFLHVTGSLLRD